jgi:TatD DNase family protein
MPSSWIDLHAHLDRLKETDLAVTIEEAGRTNVSIIVSTATDLASAAEVARQCLTFSPALYGAVGISPFDVLSLPENWEERLKSFLREERIIAVGEIGIDDTNPRYPPPARQLPVFEKQLAIALEHDLPAVIHSRGAEKRAVEICRDLGVKKAVFHCFTGPPAALDLLLDSGYYASFSGIVTFSRSVSDLLSKVPLDRLFIETDTPYLAPVPHRGETNRPAWVSIVGESVAKVKGVEKEALQEAIGRNFGALFGKTIVRTV